MTEEQKYNTLLKELAQLLDEKNRSISLKNFEIDRLKERLEAAEAEGK